MSAAKRVATPQAPLTFVPETTRSQSGEAETPTTTQREPGEVHRRTEMIMENVVAGREMPLDRLWSVEEVSYYLGVPVGTLYSWRVQRRGPACRRIGRFLRYRPEDVMAWFSSLGDWPAAG